MYGRPHPAPYDPPVLQETPVSSIAADQAGALSAEIIALVRNPGAMEILRAYEEMMAAHADEECPEVTVTESDDGTQIASYWYDECTSADGTRFRGYFQYATWDRTLPDGSSERGTTLDGDGSTFEIVAPDGAFLKGVATAEVREVKVDGRIEYEMYTSGRIISDEATSERSPWLRGVADGAAYAFAVDEGEGERSLYVDGYFTLPGNGVVIAASLPGLVVDSSACEGATAVSGSLSLRDRAGAWHEADFGPVEEGAADAEKRCDACADFSLGGQALSSFCLDAGSVSGLLGWEGKPW